MVIDVTDSGEQRTDDLITATAKQCDVNLSEDQQHIQQSFILMCRINEHQTQPRARLRRRDQVLVQLIYHFCQTHIITPTWSVACCSGNTFVSINEVTLCRARLVNAYPFEKWKIFQDLPQKFRECGLRWTLAMAVRWRQHHYHCHSTPANNWHWVHTM